MGNKNEALKKIQEIYAIFKNKSIKDKADLIESKLNQAKNKSDVLDALNIAIGSGTTLKYKFTPHKLVSIALIPLGAFLISLGRNLEYTQYIVMIFATIITFYMFEYRKAQLIKLRKIEKRCRKISWFSDQNGFSKALVDFSNDVDYIGFQIKKNKLPPKIEYIYEGILKGDVRSIHYTYVEQSYLYRYQYKNRVKFLQGFQYHFILDIQNSQPALISNKGEYMYKMTNLTPQAQLEEFLSYDIKVFGDYRYLYRLLSIRAISIINFMREKFGTFTIEIKDNNKICISITKNLLDSLGAVGIEDTSLFYDELSSGLETPKKMQMMLTCIYDLLLEIDKAPSAESEEPKCA